MGNQPEESVIAKTCQVRRRLESQGKTLLFVTVDGQLAGVLAAADTRRPEVPAALADIRKAGIRHIELLTGDNERAANALAAELGIAIPG